jgi:DNA repair exonuclease SbcCD ATPase subunit
VRAEQRIEVLKNKLQRSRATIDVYRGELKRHYDKLREEGIKPGKLEAKLKEISQKIEILSERENSLLKKAEDRLLSIERRWDE